VTAETVSITTGHPQTLHLDEKDRALVEGKSVVLVDDVISTGSTLDGMRAVVREAGGRVAAEAAVFTEGDADQVDGIVSLGHLPLFTDPSVRPQSDTDVSGAADGAAPVSD